MSQFVARILAELDDAEAKQKIEKLINDKKKLKIEIDDSDIKDILDSLSDIQKKKIQINVFRQVFFLKIGK